MKRLLIAATLCALPAFAHHGWSEYDQEKPLTLTGKVAESGYEHPHGHIALENTGPGLLADPHVKTVYLGI